MTTLKRLRCALLLFCLCCSAAAAEEKPRHAWKFMVQLHDQPIGVHEFTLTGDARHRDMKSEARFDVKFLFLTAYRYRHLALEKWNGDCLESLRANTDDGGKLSRVTASMANGRLIVTEGEEPQSLSGCVMSFAYWNPAILRQSRLLNAQTGRHESVRVVRLGDDTITAAGQLRRAHHYRIETAGAPIELWYSEQGEWLKLASTVNGGQRLVYTLLE